MSGLKRNLVPLLCIALVTASVATGIFYGLLGSRLRDAASGTPRQLVVVASRNLERGAVLKPEDVKLSSWGGAEVPKGACTALDQVTGKAIQSAILENELVTEARIVSRSGQSGIPAGMRAISVHVPDSAGVLGLLRAGERVDVQAVSERQGDVKLRTVLQNAEELSVPPAESGAGRGGAPAITLLALPADADRLALADAAGRIRLLLRNPLDRGESRRHILTLANLFTEGPDGRQKTFPDTRRPPSSSPDGPSEDFPAKVELLVRVAAVQSSAIEQWAAKPSGARNTRALEVVALGTGPRPAPVAAGRRIAMLSSTRLAAGGHPAAMQTGAAWDAQPGLREAGTWELHLQFRTVARSKRKLRLCIVPEVTSMQSGAVFARKMETEVGLIPGETLALFGLSNPVEWPMVAERLSGGRLKDADDRELLVLVTMEASKTSPGRAGR